MGQGMIVRRGGGISGRFDKIMSGTLPAGESYSQTAFYARGNPAIITIKGNADGAYDRAGTWYCDGETITTLTNNFNWDGVPQLKIAANGYLGINPNSSMLPISYRIQYC